MFFIIIITAIIVGFVGGLILFDSMPGAMSMAILAWMAAGTFACETIEKGEEQYAVRDTVEIESAVTGSQISGTFVLGTGTIDGERYYAYWISEGTYRDGAIERRKISAENWDVEVIEGTDDPKIIFTEYKKEETAWKVYVDSPYQRAEVFVPEGSVQYNYDIK